jgi:RNA polymerase sigma-70 factor (ECF subfamily)
MSTTTPVAAGRSDFDRLVGELRPRLHRYCSRMTGSVTDGEDVMQDALVDALASLQAGTMVANPQGWLFRVAHTTALDFLRRRARGRVIDPDEDPDAIEDPVSSIQDREAAAASLHLFMRLPAAQRSAVILMDVLGYSLQEISDITSGTIPAIKASLHRGRAELRELARQSDDRPLPRLSEVERRRLTRYIDRFNASDFDALRSMLAEDVKLDLVARRQLHGKSEVKVYFHQYALADHWHWAVGFVDRQPAIVARDRNDPSARPAFFVLLDWAGDEVVGIRDFLFARYAIESAEVIMLE